MENVNAQTFKTTNKKADKLDQKLKAYCRKLILTVVGKEKCPIN